MGSLILTHLSCSQSPLCQAAFMFSEECRRSKEMQRITLCPYELPALRTQGFLLLLWSAMFRCIFKNKTDTELCLAPWGNCSLLFPNCQFSAAGNRQPGVSSNIGFEMKEMQTKGTEERRGGREKVQRHRKEAGQKMKTEEKAKIWAQTRNKWVKEMERGGGRGGSKSRQQRISSSLVHTTRKNLHMTRTVYAKWWGGDQWATHKIYVKYPQSEF